MSDNDNLRHWEALERTDPAHTKPFDRGRFRGTATKPIWHERRLTEHFGPCGIGWGMDRPDFTLVPVGNELVVFCTVSLWYKDGEATGTVYGVGGDKVMRVERNGPFVSDEAYKAAYTDALGNAMKHLGVSADVHMGMFEDHKYVREVRAEFAGEPPQPPPAPPSNGGNFPERINTEPPLTLSQIRDRIRTALETADLPERVDGIMKAHAEDLANIKDASFATYNNLWVMANARKAELGASA